MSEKPKFITIYESDRKWINETKGANNREDRLHQVLEKYRYAVKMGLIADE